MLPDPLEVLRLALAEVSAVTSLTEDRIGVKLGSPEPSIRLASAGGGIAQGEADPLILAECFGRTGVDDGSASALARTLHEALPSLRGTYANGWLAGAAATGFPSSSSAPDTGRPRFLLYIRMSIYPIT